MENNTTDKIQVAIVNGSLAYGDLFDNTFVDKYQPLMKDQKSRHTVLKEIVSKLYSQFKNTCRLVKIQDMVQPSFNK